MTIRARNGLRRPRRRFWLLRLDCCSHIGEIAATEDHMGSKMAEATTSRINWRNAITVISAAILIGAEVFGGAFAGGWALSILFGVEGPGTYILQGVLFVLGIVIMAMFVRSAMRIEPFRRR